MQNSFTDSIFRDKQKWLLPLGILITLIGYFGPWVNHHVAGLVVMGLDLGEYVKFLTPVRSGQVSLWREGFYLPLLTASLVSSLYAFERNADQESHHSTLEKFRTTSQKAEMGQNFSGRLRYHWIVRALFIIVAITAALNMLPPAWAPWKLRLTEFRLQSGLILFCLAVMLISPFLGLIPRTVRAIVTTVLALGSIWYPLSGFLRILPTVSDLYNQPQRPGWGMYVMTLGLLLLIVSVWPTAITRLRGMRKINKPIANSHLSEEAA